MLSDQEKPTRCHKVTNEIRTKAYNAAPSKEIAAAIRAFAASPENILKATDDRNERIRTPAERALNAEEATKRQPDMKGDQMPAAF